MGWRERLVEGLDYLQDRAGEVTGRTVIEHEQLDELREASMELRATRRELDNLGWSVLNHLAGEPHEVKQEQRLKWVRASRFAWMNDPMAGSAIDLLNDFTFGRGVPRPRARMDEVQAILDAAWDDPDNQAVLTSFSAQQALGTDLQLQSNLFLLIFDDGDDGAVKLGMLDHDTVIDAVRDPENRLRVLYYVAQERETPDWDFDKDALKTDEASLGKAKKVYYAHWKNVQDAEDDFKANRRKEAPPKPPEGRLAPGKVYHIAMNRTTEMVFGVPTMQRTLRWFSAYNDFMSARVDMAKAAAALIMKRTVKGSQGQLQKMAARAIAGGGELTGRPNPTHLGPGLPAGVVQQSENVNHEAFNLNSGSSQAKEDATMLRSQVSAGVRLPQHYLGDQGNANLATATAMDLPVTKMVEARQELFEQLFRAFIDMLIERAIEKGKLVIDADTNTDVEAVNDGSKPSVKLGEATASDGQAPSASASDEVGPPNAGATIDGEVADRGPTPKKVDLTYEFKMPNPMRRLVTDLATVIQSTAKTFDPNGVNVELSRTLLTIMLGEGLEMQDPADAVARIFPAGWQDPLVKAQLDQAAAGAPGEGAPGAPGGGQGGGQDQGLSLADVIRGGTPAVGGEPGSGRRGPHGTKSGKPGKPVEGYTIEDWQAAIEAASPTEVEEFLRLIETRWLDLPESVRASAEKRLAAAQTEFDEIVGATVRDAVASLPA